VKLKTHLRRAGYGLLSTLGPLAAASTRTHLRVLAYHTVPDPAAYERQLRYLQRNYHVISLDELLSAVNDRRALPPDSVLITFDDGDISVYENGLPLHRKYGLPAVLFIITDLIDSATPFWWKRVEAHYRATGQAHAAARQKVSELKTLPNRERETYLAGLPPYEQRQLTRSQLSELADGGFALANHTATHPIISNCETGEVRKEVSRAARYLRELPVPAYPDVFAYPNGNSSDESERILRDEGIRMTFLFDHALEKDYLRPAPISRIRTNTYDGLPEFRAKVAGVHPLLYKLSQ
jgi:peptidoglycan/xylan/chitin deacetylase (PgdA/CDA1 family)